MSLKKKGRPKLKRGQICEFNMRVAGRISWLAMMTECATCGLLVVCHWSEIPTASLPHPSVVGSFREISDTTSWIRMPILVISLNVKCLKYIMISIDWVPPVKHICKNCLLWSDSASVAVLKFYANEFFRWLNLGY